MSPRFLRIFQFFLASLFLAVGLLILGSGLVGGQPGGVVAGAFALAMSAVAYGVFEVTRRSRANMERGVKDAIESCSKQLFDEPGTISKGYDLGATMSGFLTGFASESNEGALTAQGKFRNATISVASHVSYMGRQVGEMHHVYSHVVVDTLGLNKNFYVSKERVAGKLGKALGAVKDVKVGDKEFDDTFIVNTDDALGKAVFEDESIRKRLMSIQNQVGNVSQDMGRTSGMNIIMTNRGLALRWPGELTPELAKFIRDLLLDMREKILDHENRAAVRVGTEATAAGGYRIDASAAEPLSAEDEAEAEAEKAAG